MLNRKLFLVALCAFVVSSLVPLQGQDKPDPAKLAGDWKMTSLTPDGDPISWKLSLKQQDGKWVGTMASDQGEAAVKDLTVNGTKLHFTAPYDGEDYAEDLDLQGEKLVGTWSGNGNSGKTTGERGGS